MKLATGGGDGTTSLIECASLARIQTLGPVSDFFFCKRGLPSRDISANHMARILRWRRISLTSRKHLQYVYVHVKYAPHDWLKYRWMAILVCRKKTRPVKVHEFVSFMYVGPLLDHQSASKNVRIRARLARSIGRIPAIVLKLCSPELSSILFKLYNICLTHSYPTNYRPISLLPIMSKVFESLINQQLIDYLEEHELLTDVQYGFRHSRSTGDILSLITEHVNRALDRDVEKLGLLPLTFQRHLIKFGTEGSYINWSHVASLANC